MMAAPAVRSPALQFVPLLLWLAGAAMLETAHAGGGAYQFVIDEKASGLNATLGVNLQNTGTLVGNWDPNTNPEGTRTKPGIFGPFGPAENVPVPVSVGVGVNGRPQSAGSGAFGLLMDPEAGTLSLSGYASNLLASGPVSLATELSLEYESFRTRAPDSLYIGIPGTPIVLPLGDVTLTQLTASQNGEAAGLLTPNGLNSYDFVIAVPVTLDVRLDVLGNEVEVPGLPSVLPLAGQVVLNGDTARLTSAQDIVFENTQKIGQALPQLPFDLPTILPPGETAHLLLDLVLEQIGVSLEGQFTLAADGVLIPEPATALSFAVILVLMSGTAARGVSENRATHARRQPPVSARCRWRPKRCPDHGICVTSGGSRRSAAQ